MQTAIFGPAEGDAPPSLRPLRVHGPARWVGRPGRAEAGLLVGLVGLVGLAVLSVRWWQRRTGR
ncbi:MAG TPA: hypothetical protein VFS21_29635 [Roseiflexaceae bacterium]|nr:hypothetical protein [Roseiflexaceae bacterium]